MKLKYRNIIPRLAGAALLAAAAVMSARADYPSAVLSHSPIGYWRFDDTVASAPLDAVTNATALGSVGNGYNLNSLKGQPGMIGTSIRFSNPGNNAAVCATKIDVPWNAAFNPNPPFTVEFWAKANTLGSDATGFSPLENFDPGFFSGGSRAGWLFYLNNAGKWQFRLGAAGGSGYAGICTATAGIASPGTWQHVAATWDGTNVLLYANGVLIGTTTASFSSWGPNTGSFLRFGGTPLEGNNAEQPDESAVSTIGNRGFDGWLQQAAIYPRVLSSNTLHAHYSAASTNNAGYGAQVLADSPAGYWPMTDAPVTPPVAFPVAVNVGSLGTAANGTNYWGAAADQPGTGYLGMGGASDKAVFFDGLNGYCQINDTPGLHGITNTITMAAWIKPIAKDFFRDIIEHGFDSKQGEVFLRISRGSGAAGYGDGNYYEVGSSDGATYVDSAIYTIPAGDYGNWVFLAGTYDGANWNLYRNGLLVASSPGSFSTGEIYDATNQWTIGARGLDALWGGQGEVFGGTIDEPALFTNVLAATDIYNLYTNADVPPVFTGPLKDPSPVYTGSSVPLSVFVEGNPTLGYLWKSNGIPTGDTTTSYTINNIQVGTYTISVTASNAFGTNTQSVTFLASNEPPVIVAQPVPNWRFVGYPFTFSVGVIGTQPLTYYWELNGSIVQSGPSATYSGVASLANAGTYTVVISNLTGINATSAPVALVVTPIPGGYPGLIVSNGPIAYYRLDETNGTTCHDRIGGNDGTYFNALLGQPGYSALDPDTAVSFSGLNSYAGNISGTAINFTGHTNFSLEAWVNAPAGQNDQATIIAKGIGNNGTTETEQFSIDVVGGVYHFFAVRGGFLAQVTASDGPDGTWQHIVGVYDDQNTLGGGSNMTIYVNGVAEGSGPVLAGSGLNATISPVSIGSKRTGNDPNYDGTFDGTIDEVAIYNKALSAATVAADYAAAFGLTNPPTVLIQPSPTTNYAGLPTTLSVVASGSVPLTYQWNLGGVAIPGANSAKYTVDPTAFTDAGNYSVSITNPISGTNSITVPLVVLAAPTNPPAIPGLVLHLTFDNTLADSSGRGNNGTGQHAVATATTTNITVVAPSAGNASFNYPSDGVLGQALHYETDAYLNTNTSVGYATNDFYVTLGVPSDLQFDSTVSFTVSYWVRGPQGFGAVPGFGGDLPFFTDTAGSTFGNGFVFAPAYGYGTVNPNPATPPTSYGGWASSIFGGGTGVGVYGDLGSINDGSWHHLLHIINRVAKTFTTYLDGKVAHYTVTGGSVLGAAGDIDTGLAANIGQDPSGLYPEAGAYDIDDLGVWRKSLTPLEAASIYIAAVSNKLSYVNLTPAFAIQKVSGTMVTLTWNYGTLLSAPKATGPYTPVAGAVSPWTVNSTTGQKFYRVLVYN